MKVIEAVEEVNEYQKNVVFEKLFKIFDGNLKGKTIALWGLSFKPETDDMREAPALVIIDKLIKAGAKVNVYDPAAMDECKRRIGDVVVYCEDMYEAVIDADALAMITEWKLFRIPSWKVVKKAMRGNVVVDGRNIYEKTDLMMEGLRYTRIGYNEWEHE